MDIFLLTSPLRQQRWDWPLNPASRELVAPLLSQDLWSDRGKDLGD